MKLRDLIYSMLAKPAARRTADASQRVNRLLVLTNGHNPTFTYYLEERLSRSPLASDIRGLTDRLDDLDPDGLFVIVCRYIRPRQLLWLYRNRRKLAGTCLFIDDDVAATVTAKGGSLAYKAYLLAMGIAPLPVLNQLLTAVWASTPALAAALEAGSRSRSVTTLAPFPPQATVTPAVSDGNNAPLIIAFHATGSHDAEHAFLVPVIREVLARCHDIHFKVIAEGRPARLWSKARLPPERFSLHLKRDWTGYLRETARRKTDIMLVPLLQSRMNDVRSGTKRFDAARMGAAVIFSRCSVYERFADADEILVGNDVSSWVEAICRLARDSETRQRTRQATLRAVSAILADTPASFPIYPGNHSEKIPT